MSRMIFTESAWEEYIYWQTADKSTLKKINKLLKEIGRTPFTGEGKPEPLRYGNTGLWSRRINKYDRLVYTVTDDEIIILQCKGHYSR